MPQRMLFLLDRSIRNKNYSPVSRIELTRTTVQILSIDKCTSE